MNLQAGINQISQDYGFTAQTMQTFAAEDVQSGWNGDRGLWPPGAIWTVEGCIMYALVRYLRPDTAVELGVENYGASTVHIAAALKANRRGVLLGVAPNASAFEQMGMGPHVEMKIADGIEYLQNVNDNTIDFIFEDMDHSHSTCQQVATLAQTKLTKGGVLMVHDAEHWYFGDDVKAGLEAGGITPKYYLIEPSDCGFALWQRPEDD